MQVEESQIDRRLILTPRNQIQHWALPRTVFIFPSLLCELVTHIFSFNFGPALGESIAKYTK